TTPLFTLSLHDARPIYVSVGEALLTLGSSTIDEDIMAKQKEIDEAQKKLADAQKGLADFNAVSPIDGSVTSCTLTPGMEVKSGRSEEHTSELQSRFDLV